MANIGPRAGAADGLVIASPSTGEGDEPDYFVSLSALYLHRWRGRCELILTVQYTWTRDSALIISTILPAFLPSSTLR